MPHYQLMHSRILCRFSVLSLFFITFCSFAINVQAQPRPHHSSTFANPVDFSLPSEKPSGNAIDDRIWLTYYAAKPVDSTKGTPAVVMLHYLNMVDNARMYRFARYLQGSGISALVMELPYHLRRLPPKDTPINHFLATDNIDTVVQALAQSSSDVSTAVTWLTKQPGIDPQRIGAVGVSLGAIVTHLAMGQDKRLSAGVAVIGGGDLRNIYENSQLSRVFSFKPIKNMTPEQEAKLKTVDPLTYADPTDHRHVLMIEGARDVIVLPNSAQELWEALGKPPIQWVDVNHPALQLTSRSLMHTTSVYLHQVWKEGAPQPVNDVALSDIPKVHVLTIKTGVIFGLDSKVTPAVQLEAFKLGRRRDHLPFFSGNLGMTGRGPFAGFAATVNQFADIGLGRRLNGSKIRPYASIHIVY